MATKKIADLLDALSPYVWTAYRPNWMGGNIVPKTAAAYDIGTPDKPLRRIYVENIVSTGGDTGIALLSDGSVMLAGNLEVSTGTTIDGVDISAHAANADAHHAKQHSIIDAAHHTGSGSALDVVGFSATNTLGVLASSSAPTDARVLKSNATGGLSLTQLLTPNISTATGSLTLDPTADILIPNLTPLHSVTTNLSSFPVQGWSIYPIGSGTRSGLTINTILADELRVRLFVADETRVDRGREVVSKSYGLLSRNFTTPGTIGGTAYIYFEDSPLISGGLFSNNDWILFRIVDDSAGIVVASIWGQVSSYFDETGDEQRWIFTMRNGLTGYPISKGGMALGYGQSGQGYVVTDAVDPSGAPYVDIVTWTGANPYDGTHVTRARLGKLISSLDATLAPTGWGLFADNAFLKGKFRTTNARIDEGGLTVFSASSANFSDFDAYAFRRTTNDGAYAYFQGYWSSTESKGRVTVRDDDRNTTLFLESFTSGSNQALITIKAQDVSDADSVAVIELKSSAGEAGKITMWADYSIDIRITNASIDPAVNVIGITGNVLPNSDLSFNLGSASRRWHTLHVGTLSADTISGETMSGAEWEFAGDMTIDALSSSNTTLTITNQGAGRADVAIDRHLAVGGNLTVTAGDIIVADTYTVDGVDISAFNATYNSHISSHAETVQDTIGGILANSTSVSLAYNDSTPSITATATVDTARLVSIGASGIGITSAGAQYNVIISGASPNFNAAWSPLGDYAGAGLAWSSNTFAVGAGTLISVAADTVGISTGATYQFIGTGSGTAASWINLSTLAGNGLTHATGVLAVGAGTLISVAADTVGITTGSNYQFISTGSGTAATWVNMSTLAGNGLTHSAGELAVGAGTLITVAADTVGVSAGANYQFIGTGSGTAAGWRNVSELAGNGLTVATGVLAVGQGNGISVTADAIAASADTTRLVTVDASGIGITNATAQYQIVVSGATPFKAAWANLSGFAGAGINFDSNAFNLDTPGSLAYNTTNSSVLDAHTHAVTASADVGSGVGTEALLKSNGTGGLRLKAMTVVDGILFGSDVNLNYLSTNTLGLGSDDSYRSAAYTSDLVGWNISGNGDAEFNNITARGVLKVTALQYGYVLATGGTIWVTQAAGKVRDTFTSVDSPTTFAVNIENPEGMTHTNAGALWSVGDVVRIKEPITGDLWASVTSKTNNTTYWTLNLTKQSPGSGTNYTFYAGIAILNYGASGKSLIQISADAANAPYIQMATHSGSPWSTMTALFRAGNLNGSYGWSVNNYGLGAGSFGVEGQSWITASSEGGVRIGSNTVTKIYLAPDGSGFLASANIAWTTTGVTTIGGWTINASSITATNIGIYSGEANTARIVVGATTNSGGINSANSTGGSLATQVVFWAGDSHDNRNIADFRVYTNGSFVSTKGTIGAWTIDGTGITTANLRLFSGGANTARIEVGASETSLGGINSANSVGGSTASQVVFWAGDAHASRNTADFRVYTDGSLVSTRGSIGAWTIDATSITATNINLVSGAANTARIEVVVSAALSGGINSASANVYPGATGVIFWAGDTHANRGIADFRVYAGGQVVATNAVISGSITATSGTFTGTVTATGSGKFVAGAATMDADGFKIATTATVENFGRGIMFNSGAITIGSIRHQFSTSTSNLDISDNWNPFTVGAWTPYVPIDWEGTSTISITSVTASSYQAMVKLWASSTNGDTSIESASLELKAKNSTSLSQAILLGNSIILNGNNNVLLQYNSSTKLTIGSGGISVAGDATVSGGATITGTTVTPTINSGSGVALQYNGTTKLTTATNGIDVDGLVRANASSWGGGYRFSAGQWGLIGNANYAIIENAGAAVLAARLDANDSYLKLGLNNSNSQASFVDFITDGATETTYKARVIRNAGANGTFQLAQLGTGAFWISTVDAANVEFRTDSTLRVTIRSDGPLAVTRVTGKPSITSAGASSAMIIDSADTGGFTALGYYVGADVLLAYGGGNVGIGNNAPSQKLHVSGAALAQFFISTVAKTPTGKGDSSGVQGEIRWDDNFIYVRHGTATGNYWKRVGIAGWGV